MRPISSRQESTMPIQTHDKIWAIRNFGEQHVIDRWENVIRTLACAIPRHVVLVRVSAGLNEIEKIGDEICHARQPLFVPFLLIKINI